MFHTVNLEVSLKPFRQTDEAYIRQVCRTIFEQWRPLLKGRKTISVMLWTADGSEILDYNRNLDDAFEWCCYLGTANGPLLREDQGKDTSLHHYKQFYMDNPPVMTYRTLKTIVETLKDEGAKAFPDTIIRVGETFDIGPEFAVSDFKYHRHPEIASGTKLDGCGFVDATALLNADDRAYAAYPGGIPDQTPFATFLGRQSEIFLRDMGFDYLWLSNGLGFSADPWDPAGKIFDGKNFYADKLAHTAKQVFDFWRLFREACPDIPLEVRGTNNSVGIDYATDGVPLYDIYQAGFNITPPPNSPWAAINDDFGMEIMGHMTRICHLPGDDFMFRYYIHDPWWVNSPWYDRYNGAAHDIYLPMAISRIDEHGRVRSAETLNILSIDNSFGGMPDACVNEPLPHLLKAEKDAADRPAPLVWVYPMREYTTATDADTLREMYTGDTYIRRAINRAFPLNCVVATDHFLQTPLSLYKASVLISPIPETPDVAEKLRDFANRGGQVIYYGSRQRATRAGITDFVDSAASPDTIREQLATYGIEVDFSDDPAFRRAPVITVSPNDGALWFSVHSPYTTAETRLRFPLGAPILTGMDAALRDGYATYHFARCEHRECRIFVEQTSGIVAAKEIAPVSNQYHRKIWLTGLNDATVCLFPENTTDQAVAVGFANENTREFTPDYDPTWTRVEDPIYGVYYRAHHVSGDRIVMLPYKQ